MCRVAQAFCLVFILSCFAYADDGHHHALTAKELGSVHFENSCARAVRPVFDRGVALLHSFGYENAEQAFTDVASKDPQCAMAQWGVAMANYHGLWDSWNFSRGSAAVEKAKAIAAGNKRVTAREKAYIGAIAEIYRSSERDSQKARALAYEQAMEKIHAAYPNDIEAAIFHALAIDVNAPKTDKTYANQKRCGQILQPIFQKLPNHPGGAHYLIHCYDNPVLAPQALEAARLYAKIAPASAHAHHMPSHIFTRVGYWDESIASNSKSAEVAQADEARSTHGEARDQRLHALDYMEYAYLQSGRISEAKRVLDEVQQLQSQPVAGATITGNYATAAVPARFHLEQGHWSEASQLKPDTSASEVAQAITWLAVGMGAARSGNLELAKQSVEKLQTLRDQLAKKNDSYWSNQIEVQRREVEGWIALAQKHPEDAAKFLSSAAVLEESMEKHAVTPGAVIPAREMLASLLLQQGRLKDAEEAYKTVLAYAPNRFSALFGAGQVAEAENEPSEAAHYYRALTKICAENTERPEMVTAKKYLQAHSMQSSLR